VTSEIMIQKYIKKYPWPRRKFIRGLLSIGIDIIGGILTRWEVSGKENIPAKGPLLIVGNHFSFLDTVAPIHSTHWPLEFIGDFVMPKAPPMMRMFPRAWETLTIEQGTPNFEALQASPALPGAAFMALRTGAPILPIGTISDNDWKLFKTITEKNRRLKIFTKIGKVFGPIKSENPNRPTRNEIRSAGDLIMRQIAALLPKAYRGEFDPELS